jgi:lipoprotein-releasing system permease protein
MNFEFFFAQKLAQNQNKEKAISTTIVRIAIAAVAIAIVMMVISVSVGIGLKEKIQQNISSFSGHIIINKFNTNVNENSVNAIALKQDFYPKFNHQDIKHIQAVAHKQGIARTEKAFDGIVLKGVGKDFDWNNFNTFITKGRKINIQNQTNNEVLISEYLANRLQVKLGEQFNAFFLKQEPVQQPNRRNFKIVGLFKTNYPEFDQSFVLSDIAHIQRMNKWTQDSVGHFEVFVKNFSTMQATTKSIYKNLPLKINAISIEEKHQGLFDWLKLFDVNILLIIVLMILASSINMIVALLVYIMEKTQTIGILKAMGANNLMIRKIFLYHAIHIIIKGLIIGNLIAFFIIFIQKYFNIVTLNPDNYFVDSVPFYLNFWMFFWINLGTIVVATMALIIPTYIVSKITPVQAIKFD